MIEFQTGLTFLANLSFWRAVASQLGFSFC